MKRALLAGIVLGSVSSHASFAFFEEGNNWVTGATAYMRCQTTGDLNASQNTGCNPWPDTDANYSLYGPADQNKSSIHYNVTMGLAIAAGYNRCAAYVIALYNEGADVASAAEQTLWAPYPTGVSQATCGTYLNQAGIVTQYGLDGQGRRTVAGGYIAPTFSYRVSAFTASDPEMWRESTTFHWNPSYDSLVTPYSTQCSASGNPLPVAPNKDLVTLSDLYAWASSNTNPLNKCTGYGASANGPYGPDAHYMPSTANAKPNTLAAFGMFLHALQDSVAHSRVIGAGGMTHTNASNATEDVAGFVSGHFAGEFGVLPSTGKPGYGTITVTTPASTTPYTVTLHSDDTVQAIRETFTELKLWLKSHPSNAQSNAKVCSDSTISTFATQIASIPNVVPASGQASGAKKRSDMGDKLYSSANCTWQ